MSERVTDVQAAVFAAYQKDGKVWYELDASLTAPREDTPEGMAEFEWLRDLALDLLLARRERDEAQAHAERLKKECEAWRAFYDKMTVEEDTTYFSAGSIAFWREACRLRVENEGAAPKEGR
jgi:hypothetical protein